MLTASCFRGCRKAQITLVILFVFRLSIAQSARQQTSPQMISPAPGSTLSGPVVTFTWSPIAGVSDYSLMVGTAKGLADIVPETAAPRPELRVTRIPTDGSTVYVRLQAMLQGEAVFTDYVYTAQASSVAITQLAACQCKDVPRLQDRLVKLWTARNLVTNDLATPGNSPASQQGWADIQKGINATLAAAAMLNTTSFPDSSLYSGNGDPFCGAQMVSAGACFDEAYGVHQKGHDASCAAGRWRWQAPWTKESMLEEEAASLQAEMSSIGKTLKQLGCGIASAVCPQFMLMVQNVTNSAVNMGGMVEQSSRSLNGQQGIMVPLVFYEDGTFEGFGSGVDAGSAAGAIPGEMVRSRFGHMQAVEAFGQLLPGSCASQPCTPDTMHLVLVGGPSEQITEMHARGQVNRDMQRATPTGAARLEFNLPAYVGSGAQQTFFATAMLSSYLTVQILQAENGPAPLAQGSWILHSLQECKAHGR